MRHVLSPEFFDRSAEEVAHDLIGKFLVRAVDGAEEALMITETEAYAGPEDLASHARFGETKRTAPLFAHPGAIYAYFIYGIHWMLNVSCMSLGTPSAVLIRAAGGIVGPARLAKHLRVDRALSGKMMGKRTGLWFEDRGMIIAPARIAASPRIGVAYAGEWALKEWRFVLTKE